MKNSPVFALSMGDPAGIGPEIAVKALPSLSSCDFRIIVVGDLEVMQRALGYCKSQEKLNSVSDPQQAQCGKINVLDLNVISPDQFTPGQISPECGKAAYTYITEAIRLALKGNVAGVVTNPISKESLKSAGINFPGHTEIFAEQTGTEDFSMVFFLDNVAVAHVTTHCSLKEAIELIKQKRVLRQIRLLNRSLEGLGITSPQIAVGGLNPHAGEKGLFGSEELEHINPAIEQARSEGINVSGPYPPDTVFMRAFRGEFNGVVSMLHDHGFVALKSRDFEHGVNITIGLPIIRTSVGHGTAFDKAGTGTASPESLLSAIEAAWKLFRNR
ncbi:MAG: 4-hydroxythreonine-4-phosphate dehydrogenase PdxA [Chitinispirillaceae bacterium]